jgi:hypothetical protein
MTLAIQILGTLVGVKTWWQANESSRPFYQTLALSYHEVEDFFHKFLLALLVA